MDDTLPIFDGDLPVFFFRDINQMKQWMAENRVGVRTTFSMENGRNLLHLSIDVLCYLKQDGYIQTRIQEIINLGFDVNSRNNENMTPLHLAAKSDFTDAIHVLLKNGANIESPTKIFQYTPLYIACISGSSKAARLLLEKGANVNAVDMVGCPILFCDRINKPEIIELLLDYGASLDYEDKYGRKWDTEKYSCATPFTRKAIHKWLAECEMVKEPYIPE